jgi:hypothetical protein
MNFSEIKLKIEKAIDFLSMAVTFYCYMQNSGINSVKKKQASI